MTIGNWTISTRDESTIIYPYTREGKRIRVQLPKAVMQLKHDNGSTVEFSKYKTQGKWFYRDSRSKESVNVHRVVSEVARMLAVDPATAREVINMHLAV